MGAGEALSSAVEKLADLGEALSKHIPGPVIQLGKPHAEKERSDEGHAVERAGDRCNGSSTQRSTHS